MWKLIYLYTFSFSLLLALILTPVMRWFSRHLKIFDHPGARKIHEEKMPILGGVAMYLAFILTIGVNIILLLILSRVARLSYLFTPLAGRLSITGLRLAAITGGSALMMAIGLVDDYRPLQARVKFFCQIMVALIIALSGIRISLFIYNDFISILVTVFWITAITNAFNLLDNMDGLSAGVALIASAIFFLITYTQGQVLVSVMLSLFAGSLLGFLVYNFYPATIFMGDSGSMFIGYILSILTIMSTYYTSGSPTLMPVFMPLLILSVPIFDTLSVIYIRLRSGKSIFCGDENHFSHRLVRMGMSRRGAVCLIYLLTFCLGSGALLLRSLNIKGALVIILQALSVLTIMLILEQASVKNNRE
ncbi:MAG: undecaprenyl/decaprenyl-phosphate alpha-N-acetylglucosaminyl 1-phosphate transferase [Candidatus Omnitrophica bacterium]|nr:undecaprenyl/decaprenyl-phosphate alpha-N-acetylglucosaminyl 1-phosphate transferase [Candidatus Omnitrophota bacterium]MCK4423073.1 undecaprenyl/decaprenyl-phosphate alpha-N-acetylglucosaminyl 1-phosphate transferase [Candidatus Omnitrophota bacterium]